MVSAATQVSLLRRHGSHSHGQLFSFSLVEAEDGWSKFALSKAGQLIQQWWLPCIFWMAQSPCSLLNENNFQFRRIVSYRKRWRWPRHPTFLLSCQTVQKELGTNVKQFLCALFVLGPTCPAPGSHLALPRLGGGNSVHFSSATFTGLMTLHWPDPNYPAGVIRECRTTVWWPIVAICAQEGAGSIKRSIKGQLCQMDPTIVPPGKDDCVTANTKHRPTHLLIKYIERIYWQRQSIWIEISST